ncbi:MAG: hypothetical protein RIC19_22605 [Phaeodactylibacter sp.]|uniref:hypothetical protein n=1 Tax=Phaeodactylibacter sp. TaxID=1940289 RepID=UPI0032EBE68D
MTKIYLGLFLAALTIAGCNIDSGTIIVPDIEDEFYLELSEVFDNGERSLNWKLRTIESVGCEGAGISFSFKQEAGQVLSLNINEILAPDDCDPAEEPARAVVEVGTLNNGVYPLSLALRETLNGEGSLSVYDSFFQISIESGGGIIPLRERLYRIPAPTVWGFADYKGSEELKAAAESFISELNALTQEQTLRNGHYGYFESGNDGAQITFPESEAAAGTTFSFQRALRADEKAAVIALIETYREEHEELNISIFNTYGESW